MLEEVIIMKVWWENVKVGEEKGESCINKKISRINVYQKISVFAERKNFMGYILCKLLWGDGRRVKKRESKKEENAKKTG